jgi:hypothetical protein
VRDKPGSMYKVKLRQVQAKVRAMEMQRSVVCGVCVCVCEWCVGVCGRVVCVCVCVVCVCVRGVWVCGGVCVRVMCACVVCVWCVCAWCVCGVCVRVHACRGAKCFYQQYEIAKRCATVLSWRMYVAVIFSTVF